MSAIDLALSVEDEGWAALADVETLVRRAALAALRRVALDVTRGEISLVLGSDEAVQTLNGQWRGKDQPTDVLSFPGHADPRALPNTGPPPLIGDIILAWGVVSRQAAAESKPLADHLQHLVVHGVLHLFGFDHGTMGEAAKMEGLEREILAGLGVCDPYRDDLIETRGDRQRQ